MTIEHSAVTDPEIHEPKGISSAAANRVYVANGTGSGVWTAADEGLIKATGKQHGQVLTATSAGSSDWDGLVWHDMIVQVIPRTAGAGSPTLNTIRGGATRGYSYIVGDAGDCFFHVPHDYAMGTDLFLHVHWLHNGTAVSGNFIMNYAATYAKGHGQATFPTEVTGTVTRATPDIATIPRWSHRIDEIQLSAAAPSGSQIDSALIEPDGIVLINYNMGTIPTITGGSPNAPFILFVDLHYQAKQIGTLNKVPNFFA